MFDVLNAGNGAQQLNGMTEGVLRNDNPVKLVDNPSYEIISDRQYPVATNAATQYVTASYLFSRFNNLDDWVKFCEEIASYWKDGYRVSMDPASHSRTLRLAKKAT